MIYLSSIIFTFVLILFILFFKSKDDNLFSPLILAILIIFVTNIPYILYIASDFNIIYRQVLNFIPLSRVPTALFKYLFLLLLGTLSMAIGIKSEISNQLGNKIKVLFTNESYKRFRISAILFLILGFFSYLIFFNQVGGFQNWLNNLSLRASVTSGSGYLMILMGLTEIGVFAYISTFKYKNTRLRRVRLYSLIIFVALLLSSLGGRKGTLFFIIICVMVWTFKVGKVKRLPFKFLISLPILLTYILVVPIIRSSENINEYIADPQIVLEEAVEDFGTISKEISYVDHQLLIMDRFDDVEDLWLGKSFLDLLFAPLPSSIFEDKPPIDDGVYIRTIAEGVKVQPQTSYKKLYQSSWPPETFGTMYLNFSWLGVIVGMYLLGMMYSIAYRYMIKSNYSLFSILVYANIIINFQLSNLRIVQTVSEVATLVLVSFMFYSKFATIKKSKHSKPMD